MLKKEKRKEEEERKFFLLDQTSTVLLFLPLVEWLVIQLLSANQLLDFTSHYEDIAEFSWGDMTKWISLK